jgi:uncharacterized membrane protein
MIDMIHLSPWFYMCVLVLVCWGSLGVLQKAAVNHVRAEAAFLWAVLGVLALQPFLLRGKTTFEYSGQSVAWAIVNGVVNGLGLLCSMAAMRNGGKASVVEPLSALYPTFVALLAPVLLQETIKPLHALGIACALVGAVLISSEADPFSSQATKQSIPALQLN